jgi:xanthine/uracil/vitamin C permease (AzgA family)
MYIHTNTAAMGLFVNVPVALAPGMGLNGFFATIAPTCPQNLTGDING